MQIWGIPIGLSIFMDMEDYKKEIKNMIKQITVEELKQIKVKEGIIFQGCGGDLKEWEEGINDILTELKILLEGDKFEKIYVFENDGLTNLLFDMEDVKLDLGKLAVWRISTYQQFGGTWLSNYLENRFEIEEDIIM